MRNKQETTESENQVSLWETIPNTFVALCAATIVPAIVFTLLILLYFGFASFHEPKVFTNKTNLGAVIVVIFAGGFLALITAAVHVGILGLPATIIGWNFKIIRWWSSTIVGFFLGGLPITILGLGNFSTREYQFWQIVFLMGFLGAVGGFTFWLVWQFLCIFTDCLRQRKETLPILSKFKA